ncbi:MAG: phosphate ABC transporter permease subunit PstC [Gammaproteobacteria bacterium]|nr:phosphate ABC transporter permease subunit PstC [Gammaproteobacteria bacterium]MBU3997397.1 phosphate ABC transporter permease subunit PstC [Gammaproteobacteria bacterium]MBU4082318.1 phosphate ABC transporter permease subunit PstC [Gammaproteobacteria bacterium]MBU4112877.1 phosphate ABC transporter permease subunit PstC [Gammaproteobacteria bacterium]MBU4171770.1 phosphate ABC transporter permease subunit PstC [Gammaproteobacteria bacterium]
MDERLTGAARLAELAQIKAARRRKDNFIELVLLSAACVSVFTTLGIVYVLLKETLVFFTHVPIWDFFTDTQWTPLFDDAHYGIIVLLSGTLSSSLVALLIAVPMGTIIAIYLSEFANHTAREVLKPVLELLSGVPTIIYGFFALLFITPLIQKIYPGLPTFNILSAGIVMGIMIIPYVSSLSEDAMRAVPMSLREGSYAMGATRFQTAMRVVVPASISGIASAYILGISRAVGETMILAVAAGMQPNLTLNPLEPAATVTSFIVQVALGDLPHGSIGYQTIFAAGLTLLVITLLFNLLGHWMRRKYREVY